METNRREFLKQVILAGGLVFIPPYLLESCKKGEKLSDSFISGADTPFGVWRQIKDLLEKSPDHLIGRRKALIAEGDPKAMTEFVRDCFQIIAKPSQFNNASDLEFNSTLFGTEGALRSGLATPREKAEILKDMLIEAGFEARLVREEIDLSEKEVNRIVFRNYIPDFNLPFDGEQLKKWQKQMGTKSAKGKVNQLPDLEKEADKLADILMGQIEDFDYEKINKKLNIPEFVNTVAFKDKDSGEDVYAHVFDPEVPFGNLHPKNKADKPRDINSNIGGLKKTVKISLKSRNAFEDKKETELLSGEWKLEDLLGSMIFLQFLNNMDFKSQATSKISQITSVTPSLSFQKIGASQEFMEENSVLGEPINLNGRNVLKEFGNEDLNQEIPFTEDAKSDTTEAGDPEIKKDSIIAAPVSSESTDEIQKKNESFLKIKEGVAKDVTELEVNAIPMVYPQVKLEIHPKDSNGNIIGGLKASDFLITDNELQAAGFMESVSGYPKILFLHDVSLSMPSEYRHKEPLNSFLDGMMKRIKEVFPSAKIKTQDTQSNLYTSLLKGKQSDYDLVIYATDGDNDDTFNPEYSSVYESGKPAIILEAKPGNYRYEGLKKNIQNLISVSAETQEEAMEMIRDVMADLSFPPYIMVYNAENEKADHKVLVELNGFDIKGEATYKFFEKNDQFLGSRITGLYLTVQVSRMNLSIKRILAGWDDSKTAKPTRSDVDEVREMLLGGSVFYFEGEGATMSLRLTEYIETLLSNEGWFNAQKEGKTEEAIELLEKGTLSYPAVLLTMMQPLPHAFTEKSATMPDGFRSCILKIKPGLIENNSTFSFDYLPTSNYQTISPNADGKFNFKENLKKTATFGILESAVFSESTFSLLKNQPITITSKLKDHPDFGWKYLNNFKSQAGSGGLIYLDKEQKSDAYYNVYGKTGEVLSLLADGTGGGKSQEQQLLELKAVMEAYKDFFSKIQAGMTVTGVGTFPLGVVAAYSKTLIQLYGAASEAIILMNNANVDEQVNAALAGLACEVAKSIIYVMAGPAGNTMDWIEGVVNLLGGEFEFISCS